MHVMTSDNKNIDLQLNINEHGVSHKLIKKTSNKLLVFFSGTDKKDGRFDFGNQQMNCHITFC